MEFGSDFHKIKDYPKGKSLLDLIGKEYRLYTDGRQALEALLLMKNIRRVWCPSYYCHESLSGVSKLGIEVRFYTCTPLSDSDEAIAQLPMYGDDALIRMNYFGLQRKPSTPYGNFLIIEDHSHDLTSRWCLDSDADYCFASLRKSFPIPDGGILWSPKGHTLPSDPLYSQLAYHNSFRRNVAMEMKNDYLAGKAESKDKYLEEFRLTEENVGFIPISSISEVAKEVVEKLDVREWNSIKLQNWRVLYRQLNSDDSYEVLLPYDNMEVPFSLILLFDSHDKREKVRKNLISNEVYPAVLWSIPEGNDLVSIDFGDRMLSIHCDARYGSEDMKELAERINKAIKND